MTIKNHHVVGCLIVILIVLVAQVWSMYPAVFPDEYIHSRAAIWLPLSEAKITGYLYYSVYWITGLFGEGYLQAARVINALFHVAGCYLLYLFGVRLIEKKFAAIVSITVAFGPLASYVTYFMPDSMYFFCFWAFMLAILVCEQERWSTFKRLTIPGGLFGLLWLVKPHAVFLLPVYPAYLLIRHGLSSYKRATLFILVATGLKFIFSYVVAGEAGLSWFGSGYAEHGSEAISSAQIILQEYGKISINMIGHLVVLVTILGLSLVIQFERLAYKGRKQDFNMGIFGFFSVLLMIGIVSVFAVSVYILEGNTAHRLHVRYYGFILPLFYVLAFQKSETEIHAFEGFKSSIVIIAVSTAMLSLVPAYYYMVRSTFYPFVIISMDIPEIALLTSSQYALIMTAVIGAGSIFIWIFNSKLGVKVYGFLFLPLMSMFAFYGHMVNINGMPKDLVGVNAGLLLRENVQSTEHGSVLVAGVNEYKNDQVRMYAMSGSTQAVEIKLSASVPDSLVHSSINWIITPDSLPVSNKFELVQSNGPILLFKRVGQ